MNQLLSLVATAIRNNPTLVVTAATIILEVLAKEGAKKVK